MVHGSRESSKAAGASGAGNKGKRFPAPQQPAQKKRKGSKLTSVKNQIRAVKRLLSKVGALQLARPTATVVPPRSSGNSLTSPPNMLCRAA